MPMTTSKSIERTAAMTCFFLIGACTGPGDSPGTVPAEAVDEAVHGKRPAPGPPPVNQVICTTHSFPEVTWSVCLTKGPMKGVWIQSADIQRKPGDPFIRVLSESGPADIFVPYHQSPGDRFYDMNQWAVLDPVYHPADVGPGGSVLTFPGDTQALLGKEVRDRGLAYLCKGTTSKVRRGQELVFWSVYDAGNYDYIVQYGFRDDGTITFRVGASGYNSGLHPFEAHMHNVLWRINADIAGGAMNDVFIDEHNEIPSPTPSLANDTSTQVLTEQFIDWNPLKFTTLRVTDVWTVNAVGDSIGYALEPLRPGTARHYNATAPSPFMEWFTQHDYAVTRNKPGELGWTIPPHTPPDAYLLPQLGYTSSPPPGPPATPDLVASTDVILWYLSSAHHDPVDEDRPNYPANPSPANGITLIHWAGVDFVPHNFFDYNPLGGPTRCDPLPVCGDSICESGEDCCNCPGDCGGGESCC